MDIPSSAEVVIIGGGVAGCSIAYHLTKLGISDVVLCERGSPEHRQPKRRGASDAGNEVHVFPLGHETLEYPLRYVAMTNHRQDGSMRRKTCSNLTEGSSNRLSTDYPT